jgi:hypothetical protein
MTVSGFLAQLTPSSVEGLALAMKMLTGISYQIFRI